MWLKLYVEALNGLTAVGLPTKEGSVHKPR